MTNSNDELGVCCDCGKSLTLRDIMAQQYRNACETCEKKTAAAIMAALNGPNAVKVACLLAGDAREDRVVTSARY